MDVQERLRVTLGDRVVEIRSEGLGPAAMLRLSVGVGEVALTREEWAEVHRSLGRMLAPAALARPSTGAAEGGPARRGSPWTETEDAQLREGWADGATVTQLAEEHDRSTGAIRSWLVRPEVVASKQELVVANRARRRGRQPAE